MIDIPILWRSETSSIERDRAITTSLFALVLTAAGIAYFDARDDLYDRMNQKIKFAAITTVISENAG
jgi:hypothetical protein